MKVQKQKLPLFHLNAIPIVASELALEAAGEFKEGCVWLAYKDETTLRDAGGTSL